MRRIAVACGQPGRPLRAAQPEIRPGRRNSRQPNRETMLINPSK